MRKRLIAMVFPAALLLIAGCGAPGGQDHEQADHHHPGDAHEDEAPRGPRGGRLLVDGDFSLELALFDTGVATEYRAWASKGGSLLLPRGTLN